MKFVLLTVNADIGGREVSVADKSEALLARGHQVIVAGPEGRCAAYFQKRGVPVLPGGLQGLRGVAWFPKLVGFLRRESPDVVHSFDVLTNVRSRIAAWWAGVPVHVSTAIVLWNLRLEGRSPVGSVKMKAWRLFEYLTAPLDAATIAVSDATREDYRDYGYRRRLPTRLYECIPPRRPPAVDLSHHFEVPVDRPCFVAASRLVETKGIPDLLHAADLLQRRGRDFHVLHLGSDPTGDHNLRLYTKMVRRLGIANRITFGGWWSDDLVAVLGSATALVLPSHAEGCPLVLSEAMLAGTPSIAYRAGGSSDVIVHGETGYLVDRFDVPGLAKAMETVLDLDVNARARIRENCRNRLEGPFSFEKMMDDHLSLYRRCLRAARAGASPGRGRSSLWPGWKRIAVATCDRLTAPLQALGSPRRLAAPPRRILLLRTDHLGDLMMTLPAVRTLREAYPAAQIDLLCSRRWESLYAAMADMAQPLATQPPWTTPAGGRSDGWIGTLRQAWGLRANDYDLAVSFRPDPRDHLLARIAAPKALRLGDPSRGGRAFLTTPPPRPPDGYEHEIERCLRLLRPLGIGQPTCRLRPPALSVSPEQGQALLAPIRQESGATSSGRIVAIHPGAASPFKRWSLDGFAELARNVAEGGRGTPVFLAAPSEVDLAEALVRKAKPADVKVILPKTVADLASVLAAANLLVCNDSGPMHLAEAVGTAVVVAFGPTNEALVGPVAGNTAVVAASCESRPCWEPGTPPPTCSRSECFEGVTTERILAAVDDLLANSANAPADQETTGGPR